MNVYQWFRGAAEDEFILCNDNKDLFLSSCDGYVSFDGDFYISKPSGVGYYNGTFYAHEDLADALINKLGLTNNQPTAKDCLVLDYKWISLSFGSSGEFFIAINHRGEVSQSQRDILFEIFKGRKLDFSYLETKYLGRD